MIVVELDVRGLPPPEPFLNITQSLQMLENHETLRVVIHREPYPLYAVLGETGYAWQTTAMPDGNYEILIRRQK